jgi:hypothetical protein
MLSFVIIILVYVLTYVQAGALHHLANVYRVIGLDIHHLVLKHWSKPGRRPLEDDVAGYQATSSQRLEIPQSLRRKQKHAISSRR